MLTLLVLALTALVAANPLAKRAVAQSEPSNPVKNHAWSNTGESHVALNASLNTRLEGAFTLEAWVYNEDPGRAFQPIIAHAVEDAADIFHADFVLQTNANNGRVSFVMGAGPDTYGFQLQGTTLAFNKWTHIAVVVTIDRTSGDPATARLYQDGALTAQADRWGGGPGSRQVSDESINLGYVNLGGEAQRWIGQIDEVRVWDSARSQAQIKRDLKDPFLFSDPEEIPLNLAAYYSFDAGPETSVWDNSRQPYYDGLPINGQMRVEAAGVVDVPLPPTFAPLAGPESHGLEFSGMSDATKNSVELPTELSRRLPRGFTFEAWVYMEAPPLADQHYKTIVSRFSPAAAQAQPGTYDAGSNPEADFVFQVDPRNGRLVFFMGGGRGECERTSLGYGVALFSSGEYNLKAYEWTHVAFTVFGTQTQANPFMAKMYVNGREVPQAPELPGNAWREECERNYLRFEPIHVGYYNNGMDQYWEGRIDEVRFWAEPRDDAAISADYIRPLKGTEEGLLAYYQMDEGQGTVIRDATRGQLNGQAMLPSWVPSQGVTEVLDGVSGFPVHLTLQARSSLPQDEDFTFEITELPANGGLFTTGTPIELLEQADVDNARQVETQLTYVSNIGFNGYDTFGYVAVSAQTGLKSETHYVVLQVADYQEPAQPALDACGVPGGDGTSCVGGCDGQGGEIDECGVCGGKGASCTCVFYKTFHTDELDCVLFENQVNVTMARIENSISTLHRTLGALTTFDQNAWRHNFFDLGIPLERLCAFGAQCLEPFEGELADFESDILGDLKLCEAVPTP